MIDRIIDFSVRNKLIIGLLVLLLMAGGIYSATQLPVDAVPDITNNQVLIITVSPSLAAPEIERLITTPTERLMASLPDLKEMRSISRFGLSNVTVVFDDHTDITKARQQVSERLSQLKTMIPSGLGEPDMGPITTGLGEVYQYYVVPKEGYESRYTLTDLRTIQEWVVRRQLLGVSGVADVSSLGGSLKQYQVVIDPQRIQSLGVTLDELYRAIVENNENSGGAYIEKGPNAYYIRTEGLANSMADLRMIPVKNIHGVPLMLGEVAEVKEGNALRFGAMYNSRYGEVAGAVVLMLKGANAMEVVQQVKDRVEVIKKHLPVGVTIVPYYQRSKMVGHSIATVKQNLIEGALIVIFVLVFFLGSLRSGLVVASVIPLSMLFALIIMNIFHVSANLMSLGALDFGLIVDGAVIIVEGVMHRFREKIEAHHSPEFTEEEINTEVKASSSRLMNAAIFGQIIILVVYLPILSLEGIEGKMFRPMAETVAFALVGAFILSLTYVPMMTALTINRKVNRTLNFADRIMATIQRGYAPLLKKALKYPKTVILAAAILIMGAFWVFTTLGGEFIPQLEEGDFALDARFLPGTSLTQTIKGMATASAALKRFPEVQQVTCRVGSAEIPTDPMSLEQCDIFVTLNEKSTWTSATDYAALSDTMGKKLAEIPGLNVGFEYPVQMRFNELISGAKQDVVVKIYGDDLQVLARQSQLLSRIIGRVKGAADINTEKIVGLPQLVIHYHRSALAQYNVTVSQINHIVNATFAGQKAGSLYEGERKFDIVLRIGDGARSNLSQINQLLIPTPGGLQVPLNQLAAVTIEEGPNQIQRDNGQRRIAISFNIRGRDVESVVKEVQQHVQGEMHLPTGYYVEYGGQFQSLNSAKARLAIAVPASLFFIFILLYFAFNQFREAILVFSAIPLAATGGVFALWIRGMSFSISAGVGFIALFGVAVLNGIVLITEFNRLKKEGEQDIDERIRKGTANRLRPVLMTAAVASLGFFPMAISTHAGAEVQRPLATVVIGGLITATLLTLLVLPALYRQFAQKSPGSKKAGQSTPGILPVAILAILVGLPFILRAQQHPIQSIKLPYAIDQALRSNLSLQSARMRSLSSRALVSTAYDLPKTLVTADIGQINSSLTDNRLTINQNIPLPFYYRNQHNYLSAEAGLTLIQEESLKIQLAYSVRDIYLQMAAVRAKLKLLSDQDSVYRSVIQLEELRLKVGETSRINLTSAAAKQGYLKNQEQLLAAQQTNLQSQLQTLLASEEPYQAGEETLPDWEALYRPDSTRLMDHPEVRQIRQQVELNRLQVKLTRSRGLPELIVGYSNQTFSGPDVSNSSVRLTQANRFSSVLLGLNVPLLSRYHAAAYAAKFQVKSAQFALSAKQLEWIASWRQAKARYDQERAAMVYYEGTALKQAAELIRMATLSFHNGDISYLEWANLYTQSIQLRTERLDALLRLDQTINLLWYYQGQTHSS